MIRTIWIWKNIAITAVVVLLSMVTAVMLFSGLPPAPNVAGSLMLGHCAAAFCHKFFPMWRFY